MLKKIMIVLIVLALIIGGLAVYVHLQPAEFHVERTATIPAPAEQVFAHVNDLNKWEVWSPWAKLDPKAKYTYEGAASGKGAVVKWSGNSEVGEGSMTITESRPHELIRMKLDFIKPMEGTAKVEFTFKENDKQTEVTWSMSSENNFMGKAMGLFMNMEKMVGDQYEEGLTNLKSVVEGKKGGK